MEKDIFQIGLDAAFDDYLVNVWKLGYSEDPFNLRNVTMNNHFVCADNIADIYAKNEDERLDFITSYMYQKEILLLEEITGEIYNDFDESVLNRVEYCLMEVGLL